MDTVLTQTISFLGVAILVAIIARRVRLPYTVGLVLTGIGLAVAGLETGAMLTHDFIFEVIPPPLLFEAALSIRWRELQNGSNFVFACALQADYFVKYERERHRNSPRRSPEEVGDETAGLPPWGSSMSTMAVANGLKTHAPRGNLAALALGALGVVS
jgi:hypothetical protein